MARIIPDTMQIKTFSATVDLTERGSAKINEMSEVYTMADIIATIGASASNQFGDVEGGYYAEFDSKGQIRFYGDARQWDDLKFPLTGSRLDTASGRLDYNFFVGGVGFAATARYPEEPISMLAQLPHAWAYGTGIRPHIHWLQQSSDIPNWLLAYKIQGQGAAATIDTDFSGYTFAKLSTHAFTYESGIIAQISGFPEIDMTGYGLSDIIHFVLFRDSTNVSGLFAGADPSAIEEFSTEFDVHYLIDKLGSDDEYTNDVLP